MLQRSVGNAAVAALIRGQGGVLARRGFFGGAENDQEEYEDAIDAKRDFLSSPKGPENFRSSTGIGGFNVGYDPQSWVMNVILRGAVSFIDGIELQGGIAIAHQPAANVAAAANAINSLPPEQRAAAVADWQWGDGGRATFLAKFQEVVMKIWSGQHMFHCSRKYWEDVGAIPSVSAEVHAGEKTDDDHMAMTVYKVPTTFIAPVGVVNSGSGGLFGRGASQDNTMTLNSVDVEERRDSVLNVSMDFAPETTTIPAASTAQLTQFAIRFKSGGPVCSLCGNRIEQVGGVAISVTVKGDGTDPEATAKARFDAICTALAAAGLTDAATRLQYSYGGPGGVDAKLQVGDGVAQIVAAHEAGHMFGLGDRYATTKGSGIGGTGPSAGLPSKHDELAKDEGLGGAKAANDDGIMSWGSQVRPADYATFMEALKDVSGVDEWAFGPTQAVVAPGTAAPGGGGSGGPSGPGDFPTPAPGAPAPTTAVV